MIPFQPHIFPQAQQVQRRAIEHYQYNLCDVIGKGFSSTVFKGINQHTNEVVAIKVVEQRALQEQVQQMVLTNEIETLKKVKGENILKLHDVFHTMNNTYIITEFCNAGDIGSFIKQNGPFKEIEAIKTLKHIVNGLKELDKYGFFFRHNLLKIGIVHRDLKPENILLRDGIPKIADFGFAKSLDKINKNPKQEFSVGTPLYMSPETLTKNEYSNKTDIWSLGVLYFELLFGIHHLFYLIQGHIPWQANTEQELIHQIFNVQVQFPNLPIIKDESKDLILRALQLDPNQRISLKEIISHKLMKRRKPVLVSSMDRQVTNPQFLASIPVDPKTPNSEQLQPRTLIKTGKNAFYRQTLQDTSKIDYQQMKIPLQETNFRKQETTSVHNPQSPEQQKNDFNRSWLTKCEEILSSYLDFCNFLEQIIVLLDQPTLFMQPMINMKLKFLIAKNIMIFMSKLKDQMDDDQTKNPLKLQAWRMFIQGPQYSPLRSQIREEYQRYEKLFQQIFDDLSSSELFLIEINFDADFDALFDKNFFQFPSFYMILQKFLQQCIQELNHNLLIKFKPDQIPKLGQRHLSLLDQLLSYFRLVKLLRKNLFDPYTFVEYAKISTLMEIHSSTQNQQQFTQIRQKIKQLVD